MDRDTQFQLGIQHWIMTVQWIESDIVSSFARNPIFRRERKCENSETEMR